LPSFRARGPTERLLRGRRGGGRGRSDDVDAAALAVELDHSVDQREQRIIAAAGDVAARVVLGAALPDDDPARAHRLAAVDLHPQPLAVRIAAVLDRPLTFLVSHGALSLTRGC